MAKKSVMARQAKRERTVAKYAQRRADLKKRIVDMKLPVSERRQAQLELQKMPRDASPSRLRNRCPFTGRPRGVYRHFGIARGELRNAAMFGAVPGLVKSSW